MVTQITSESEYSDAVSKDALVVVDFFATWCGPCKMIAPMIEKFDTNYADVLFYKVDVDALPEVAQKESITSMPTFLFYKSGKLLDKVTGANPAKVKQLIEENA
ncbi:HBL240Wp [Eremothecium sinecaudum]|uniref:Thioredoxin n=1 Tax=Eremothecium sinecaudum TaxID=45286 RepID=A0A120K0T5_9SACH|nr:HBL240Wp [Eremothecium sinecaudum]AMD18662.1 HBL240Wp [Eremothecium sinecaudum]